MRTRSSSDIRFHDVHGQNVRLEDNNTVAKRIQGFGKALVFSHRAIRVGEMVSIRLAEVVNTWNGVLRLGVTNSDPVMLTPNLPKYACPDMTNKPGTWAKSLPERHCVQDAVISLAVSESKDVSYYINGHCKGIFLTGVSTSDPLFVVVDIYGNTTGIQFVDESNAPVPSQPTLPTTSRSSLSNRARRPVLPAKPSNLQLASSHANATSRSISMQENVRQTSSSLAPPNSSSANSLVFHAVHGRHIVLNFAKSSATRTLSEYSNGYVFTCRPIRVGERVCIQVTNTCKEYGGGLGFGVTCCNPGILTPNDLPDDADHLLDRSEYWVVQKDIAASTARRGDTLTFFFDASGAVYFAKNGEHARVVLHVDVSLQLWMFFDVYGTTQAIEMMSSEAVAQRQQRKSSAAVSAASSSMASSMAGLDLNTASLSPLNPLTLRHTSTEPDLLDFDSVADNRTAARATTVPFKVALPTPDFARASAGAGSSSAAAIGSTEPPSDDANECTVCMEAAVNSVLIECGHMCMCYECALDVHGREQQCPICRKSITRVIKVFKS